MPQAELTRKTRKQLATFKGELSSRKIHTREQLDAFVSTLPPKRYKSIVGLVPLVFPAPNRGAN